MQNEIATLRDYEILERLGNQKRRKFCEVFKLRSKISGELFILKTAHSEHGRESLKAESTFSFNQSGLPKVSWFIEDEQSSALLLTYKEGITLDTYFKRFKRKEQFEALQEVIRLLQPILDELKANTIAHLDLKPSNILIDPDKKELHLIDFGLAIKYSEANHRKLIFPLGYAAPEVILNRLHLVDHRSDYFSLSVVIYQLFSGKLPLLNPNPSITTNLQITHPLPEVDVLDKTANQVLGKLGAKFSFAVAPNSLTEEKLDNCLQQGITERYDSIEDFIQDFAKGRLRNRFLFF